MVKLDKLFLLSLLVLLLIGVSYATEVNNDTTTTDTLEVVKDTNTTSNIVDNSINEDTKKDKEITKKANTNKTTKTASKTYDVSDYNALHNALTNGTYTIVTLNINSDITLFGNTELNETIKTLTINGNGQRIDGQGDYQFLEINPGSNVTIKNIRIINCNDYYGGAIVNYRGDLTILNSTISKNCAEIGGAIANSGSLTIINSSLNNNDVYSEYEPYGGAIINLKGTLTIQNTILYDNSAFSGRYESMGGAIYNVQGTMIVTNTKFIHNCADYGGSICNEGTLNITDSIFNNNTAFNGGAIRNYGSLTLTNSTFNNNTAYYGGAIYNEEGTLNLTNSTFNNNTSNNYGGAIYNDATMIIDNNLFITNKANTTGKIIIDKANATIENNTNDETYRYSSTIYTNGTEVTIINNIFDNKETTLTINKIANVKLNNTVTITGKLTDDIGKTLSNTTVNIKINDKSVNVKTNSNGVYKYTTKTTIPGLNNITVTYNENEKYLGSSNNTTFLVKQPTCINLASTSNVKYGTTVKLVGRLLNGTRAVKYVPVNVTVNDKVYNVKTDGAGYIRVNHTVDTYDNQKVTFKFAGNKIYASSSNSTMFKVKQPTCIKIANMINVKYGSTVKLVGRLLNGTRAVKYVPVNVTVNGKIYKIKTDGAGYIRLNYTVNSYDNHKVTFKFAGNSLYLSSTNSTTFKVKQPTWIKIASMSNVKYGSTVKIVARLLYNGTTALKYKQVNITVNGKVYTVKSDGAGYIRLNYTVKNYDNQKISFKYAGSTLYLASSNSTTFKVKQPTWIKHASIGKVKQGSTVKIVGRVLYNGTSSVKYVTVNVTVNGKVYKLKTNGAGYFRLNYTAKTLGTFTFTSNFGGNTLYLASTNSTKFTVIKT